MGSDLGGVHLWCGPSPATSTGPMGSSSPSGCLLSHWAKISSPLCFDLLLYADCSGWEGWDFGWRGLCGWGGGSLWRGWQWRLHTWQLGPEELPRDFLNITPLASSKESRFSDSYLGGFSFTCCLSPHVTVVRLAPSLPACSLGLIFGSGGWAVWTSCESNIFEKPQVA